ncbi:MAG: replicative DNA helicase [Nitrospirae bacterium]|nr:replicative DNA helicase [Nitrospirota bacterium]
MSPQNVEAEQAILGAIMLENSGLDRAVEFITADDFYKEAHRRIFIGMIELSEAGEAIDIVTLPEALRKRDALERAGGVSYLATLVNTVPNAANIRYHCKIVREKAILRSLISTASDIITKGYEDNKDVDEFLDEAERTIFEIAEKKIKPSFFSVKDIVKDSFEMIEKLYNRKEMITGVPTGFTQLDEYTAGLQDSDLIIVAGRPSMGKTAFCLNIASHVAIEKNIPIALFSLEMSKEQLVTRMLASEARVDAKLLRTGHLQQSDWNKLTAAAGVLSEAPIFIDDSSSINVLELRAKARRLKREHGLGLIVIDYLQLMRGYGNSESRQQEISDISRSLKGLAKELACPVIALSQLNRAVETRPGGGGKPLLADLRESGAIEQDADVIMFIYREEFYKRCECPKDGECMCGRRGKATINIGKQRNGPAGVDVDLTFIGRYARFENRTERSEY